MPKIRVIKQSILQEIKEFTIMYTQSKMFHFKEDMSWLRKADFPQHGFDTEVGLIQRFKKSIRAYQKMMEKVEKVIVINTSVGMLSAMTRNGMGSYSGGMGKWHGVGREALHYGLSFEYRVYKKISGAEDKYYELWNGEESSRATHINPKKCTIVPYSEAKIQFLESMASAMLKMAEKFVDYFQSDDIAHLLEQGDGILLLKD